MERKKGAAVGIIEVEVKGVQVEIRTVGKFFYSSEDQLKVEEMISELQKALKQKEKKKKGGVSTERSRSPSKRSRTNG